MISLVKFNLSLLSNNIILSTPPTHHPLPLIPINPPSHTPPIHLLLLKRKSSFQNIEIIIMLHFALYDGKQSIIRERFLYFEVKEIY